MITFLGLAMTGGTVNLLKMKCRLLYSRPSSYHTVNTFLRGLCCKGEEITVCSQINTKHTNTMWTEHMIMEC
jgi:hypothetical protein